MADKKKERIVLDRKTGKSWKTDVPIEDIEKGEGLPLDWKPWAMAGGGGLLSYLAAKAMIGDGDEEEKEQSAWTKMLPYLVGAAGAAGGYALSKHAGDRRYSDRRYVEFDIGEDGKPRKKDMPTGDLENWLGWGGYLGGAAQLVHLGAGAARRNNENAARFIDALDAEARRDAYRKQFMDTRDEAFKARDRAANMGAVVNELKSARKPDEKAIANAKKALGEANAAYDSAWRRYTGEAVEMAGLDRAASDAVNNAGPKYKGVRERALQPAEPKPLKGGAIAAPAENAYVRQLRANAAKARPVEGGSLVGYHVRKALNALGTPKGGRWLNGLRGLLPAALSVGFGYGAQRLGGYQNEDRDAMLKDFKEINDKFGE